MAMKKVSVGNGFNEIQHTKSLQKEKKPNKNYILLVLLLLTYTIAMTVVTFLLFKNSSLSAESYNADTKQNLNFPKSRVTMKKLKKTYDGKCMSLTGRASTVSGRRRSENTTIYNPLEFVHITKTGGSSIEEMGAEAGIAWARCKFELCNQLTVKSQVNKSDWECNNSRISPWHCPPMHFRSGINMYNNSTTFAIVRNPYQRIISEYYWKKLYINSASLERTNKRKLMNDWVKQALGEVEKTGTCLHGHCVPMHKYTHYEGKQIIDHILHMENLSTEWPALMKKYDLQMKMKHTNTRNKGAKLGVKDLSKDTIRKINEWAKLDFEYFGYEMIDS